LLQVGQQIGNDDLKINNTKDADVMKQVDYSTNDPRLTVKGRRIASTKDKRQVQVHN